MTLDENAQHYDPERLPRLPVLIGFAIFCVTTAFVLLALTAFTHNLDDIKITGLFIGGAVCLTTWAVLWASRRVAAPPRLIWVPYLAYLGVCIVSTIAAEAHAKWAGWYYVLYNTCLFGFVLLGSSVVQTKRMVELTLKFWVLIAFITTGFGLIHYSGLLEPIYAAIWGKGEPIGASRLQALVLTFIRTREMLSTILNVQFFGNFLMMLVPVTVSCVVFVFANLRRKSADGDPITRPIVWTIISGLAFAFSLTCIFTTYSKTSFLFLPVTFVLYAAGMYFFAHVRRIPYLWLIAVLGAVMAATILSFTWGDLQRQLKDVGESTAPRVIIYNGALEMFKDSPALGMGPGTFRIYFPQFRNPDYHLTRISNLTLYAHNWMLDILAETGLAGFIAYLTFLLGGAWIAWQALRHCPDIVLKAAVLGVFIGTGALLAGSLLTPMSRWPVGSVALHAMIGSALGVMLMALRSGDDTPRKAAESDAEIINANPRATPEIRWALVVVVALFTVYTGNRAVVMFRAAYNHNMGLTYTDNVPVSLTGTGTVISNPQAVQMFGMGVDYFNKALELDPTRLTTYYKLAHAYNRLDRQEDALKAYLELQKFAPNYAEVHFNLAVMYYQLAGQEREVAAAARRGGDSQKAEEARAMTVKHLRSAAASFEAMGEMSTKVSVHFFLAVTLSQLGDELGAESEEGKELLRRAGDVYSRTAKLPVSRNQDRAQSETDEAYKLQSQELAAELYARAGAYKEAAEASEEYVKLIPTSISNLRRAADNYRRAGLDEDARRVVDQSLAANPFSPDVQLMKFELLRNLGLADETLEQGKFLLVLNNRIRGAGGSFLPDDIATKVREQLMALEAGTEGT